MSELKWREAVPRIVADFVIVQLSMIGALAVSVVYQTALGNGPRAKALIDTFAHYYTSYFWVLSLMFPVVFWFNGFYTHTRAYTGKAKTWVVIRGVALAITIFFAINVALFERTEVGRSAAIAFMVLAGVGLTSLRLLKALFEKRFDIKPKNTLVKAVEERRGLVIGGAGYIGSLVVENLLQKGYQVRVLDALLYGAEPLHASRHYPDFELMIGDCRNIQDVVRAVHGVDSIIHLAAIVGDPACKQDSEAALEINYAATRMLVEIAKGNGIRRVIFASSCSVYGAADSEMNEGCELNPISLYGQTKVDSERALLSARDENFHPTVLRYATVYGLGYRPRFDLVVNLLTAKACQEGVITIFNGEQWRPFIHVRDLVDATVRVLDAPLRLVSGEIFNIGDSRLNHTLEQVGEIVLDIFPGTRVEHIENSDKRNYRVSFDKFQKRFGFKAHYTLRDGVLELQRAFEEGVIKDYTDIRYNNHRFLEAAGTPTNKREVDGFVMAAFSSDRYRPGITPLRVRPSA